MFLKSKERLQKVLSSAGLASRREIERWIRAHRITINNKEAILGDRVSTEDLIKIDNKPINIRKLLMLRHYIILYNKPEGEIVSHQDVTNRPNCFQKLPYLPYGRWINVGRLDINSSGLLIFTTNGELSNRLMHPSSKIEREYAVRVHGKITEDMLQKLVNGIYLKDGLARFEEIIDSGGKGKNHWFHIVIMEGRKREVRRIWEAVNTRVSRLKRVRFGSIMLDSSVKAGQWRELTKNERSSLLSLVNMKIDSFKSIPKNLTLP